MEKIMENHIFVKDMVGSLSCLIDPESATRGIRALCRYFGGQLVYVPKNKADGRAAEKIRGVLADEIGDADAEKILEKLMAFYGGIQTYIPLERNGFREDIAREIYEKYDSSHETMNELCREYGFTFAQVYRCYHNERERRKRERELKSQRELFEFSAPKNQ
jgi:Mor family transcriptional regulator